MRYKIRCVGINNRYERGGVEVVSELLNSELAENEINNEEVDTVISFWPPLSVLLLLKYFFRKKKIICYEHFDLGYISLKWRVLRILFYWRAHKVVCITTEQYQSLLNFVPRHKLKHVVNPVVNVTHHKPTRKKKIILFVGHLRSLKRPDKLVKSFATLKNNNRANEWCLHIVGSGEMFDEIQNLVESENICDSVKLFGYQEDVAKFYSEATVFVLPSRTEGLPLVILEAMSYRCLVVSTKYSKSARDLIKPYFNGLLLDNIEDLSDCLEFITSTIDENPFTFSGIVKNAEEYVARFSSEKFINTWKEILSE